MRIFLTFLLPCMLMNRYHEVDDIDHRRHIFDQGTLWKDHLFSNFRQCLPCPTSSDYFNFNVK